MTVQMETQYWDATAIARRTRIPGGSGATNAASPKASANPQALPDGSQVAEFRIEGLIGQGGFGIVYRAYDTSLHRAVALKEYMPSALAIRSADGRRAEPRSVADLPLFDAGLKSFVNEARLLACFDHPALVKVFQFWEANGTAYMAMPMYEGPTLRTVLQARGAGAPEAEIRRWLLPLLDAIDTLHQARCYHRDIAPDNILITPGGPLLLDFGAARQVIGDMTRALTVVLKPGYAPIEQYGEDPSIGQGPWTDLYALACVVRYAITGHTPISSVERILSDRMRPLSEFAGDDYSPEFLRAIDHALAVRPDDRPQSVDAFRALLAGAAPGVCEAVDIEIFFDDAEQACDLPLTGPAPLDEPASRVTQVAAEEGHQREEPVPRAASGASVPPRWRWGRRGLWALAGAAAFIGAAAVAAGLMHRPETMRPVEASPMPTEPLPAPASSPPSGGVQPEPAHVMRSVDDSIELTPRAALATPQPSAGCSAQAVDARKKPPAATATRDSPAHNAKPEAPEVPSTPVPVREDERCADLLLKASLGTELSEDRVWRRRNCQ
ncbi:hypothetical protein BH11PSE9_BH11PSE9_13500 [soil metagenome]